jgi:hypothetical protein
VGAVVHNEEETVVQLMKLVRIPPRMVASVGVVFLVVGIVGAFLTPWTPGETSDLGFPDWMMMMYVSSPSWGHHL